MESSLGPLHPAQTDPSLSLNKPGGSPWLLSCRFSAFTTLTISLAVFGSWVSDSQQVLAFSGHWIPMAPNTALAFSLNSFAILLLSSEFDRPGRRRLLRVLLSASFLLCLARLLELALSLPSLVDEAFFQVTPGQIGGIPIGRMSFPTALAFLFLNTAALAATWREQRWALTLQTLSSAITFGLGSCFLLGYLYGAPLLYNNSTIPMALLTSIGFVLNSLSWWMMAAAQTTEERVRHLQTIQDLNVQLRERVKLLDQSRSDLASLTQRVQDGLIVFSPKREKLYCNSAADQLLQRGFPLEHLPEGPNDGLEISWEDQFWEVRSETTRWRGQEALLLSLRDVTARHQAQQQRDFNQEQLYLSQKMEAIGRLAGNVAHDFNNILTAILGYCGLLREETLSPEARQFVEELTQTTQRASDLSRQLLAYSRHSPWQLKVCDLNQVVRESQKFYSRLLDSQVKLQFHLTGVPLYVRIDPSRLEQVLMNLLVNARDASPTGAKIQIETSQSPPDGCLLQVRDPGCGIAKEHQQKIFEPFFTTRGETGGTGLGLAISRSIVEQLEGRLEVESTPGVGTTFTIWLPQAPSPEPSLEAPTPDKKRDLGKILLVEDEEAVRRLLKTVLLAKGWDVVEADGPTRALALIEQGQTFQFLLTDLQMPDGSGYELARRLVAQFPHLKVMLMSGYAQSAEEARENPFPYLQKPFTPRELQEKLDALALGPPSEKPNP